MEGSEKWLPNASVSFHIEEEKSQWHVYLTFINPDNPQEYLMHHMGTHRTESLAKVASILSVLVGRIAAWNDARVTRQALEALSDRELDDLGLTRGDIEGIASGSYR